MPRTYTTRPSPARVYICDAGDGVVKVGCSKRPRRRRCALRAVYRRERMDLLWMSDFHKQAFDIEWEAHQLLKEYRIGPQELFRCSPETAKAAVLLAIKAETERQQCLERAKATTARLRATWAPQQDAHVTTEMAARHEAKVAADREAARAAEIQAAMATAAAQAEAEAACSIRPRMLAAEALCAANPEAAAEAVAIWKSIAAAWRGKEDA